MVVDNPFEWLGKHFPDRPTTRQIVEWYNIWWRVGVARDIPPTDPIFEYRLAIGQGLVDKVLRHEPIDLSRNYLAFYFPERHLTTPEEQMFVSLLQSHPQVFGNKMTIIDVVTKSPLIVGSFLRDDVRILSHEETTARRKAIDKAWAEGMIRLKFAKGRRRAAKELDEVLAGAADRS